MAPSVRSRRRETLSRVCALEPGDVDLLHLEHGLHHASGPLRVGVAHPLEEDAGHDLPGHAVLVLEPAALLCLRVATQGERVPVMVDLRLRLAVDLKRDGFVELEDGATV